MAPEEIFNSTTPVKFGTEVAVLIKYFFFLTNKEFAHHMLHIFAILKQHFTLDLAIQASFTVFLLLLLAGGA